MKKQIIPILLIITALIFTACGQTHNSAQTSASYVDESISAESLTEPSEIDASAIFDYVKNAKEAIESTAESETSFDDSQTYSFLVEAIDTSFNSFDHSIAYDNTRKELNIYIEAPSTSRFALVSGNQESITAWKEMVDAMTNLGSTLYTTLHASNGGEHVMIYFVDRLDSGNKYNTDDYLLWIDNDTVKYNYLDEISGN